MKNKFNVTLICGSTDVDKGIPKYCDATLTVRAEDIHHTNLAAFFTQAGAVASETGLTPRQLAEQRTELLEACKAMMKAEPMQQGERNGCIMGAISLAIDQARQAIAKAEGRKE